MITNILESISESDISEALLSGKIPEDASEMTVLLIAYIREKEIQKFYSQNKKRLTSPTTRKIFNELARQKIDHQNLLKAYYDESCKKLQMSVSIDEITGEHSFPVAPPHRHADLLDVFQLTMEMEKLCHDFFEDALDYISNHSLVRAFKLLATKEKRHIEYLVNEFLYQH